MPRKRTHDEMAAAQQPSAASREDTMLMKLRNMWEFVSLFEWMHIFGAACKLPQIDMEDLEQECTKDQPSLLLEEFGYKLVNFISSRRDITLENWDIHVRRQYDYRAPTKTHPYGEEEEPNAFRNFHVFTKIRVLHQLTIWSFWNPDWIRHLFPSDYKELDQFLDWNMHPYGWDRQDRTYYLFSPERLYRRTDPPIPEPEKKATKTKYSSKKGQAQRRKERASKRRRIAESEDDDTEMGDAAETMDETRVEDETAATHLDNDEDPTKLNTFGDYKFECIAITLDEYNEFLSTIEKSKDQNERNLKDRIKEEVLPALLRQEESRQRKIQERVRAAQMEQKMLGAKRSSRLQHKAEEKEKEAEEVRKKEELEAAQRWQSEQEEVEHQRLNARRQRIETREERTKNREMERILREAELARDSEDEKKAEQDTGRESRVRKTRIKENKKRLEEWTEDDTWYFDCAKCGQYGQNKDDGQHSISCEKCNVWQHSKCLGFTPAQAEKPDFHFVCQDCVFKEQQRKADEEEVERRQEEEANRPKISLKFKVGPSSSPPQPDAASQHSSRHEAPYIKQQLVSVDLPPVDGQRKPVANGNPESGQHDPAVQQNHQSQSQAITQPAYAPKGSVGQHPYTNGHEHYNDSRPSTSPNDSLKQSLQHHVSAQQLPNTQHYRTPGQPLAQTAMSSVQTQKPIAHPTPSNGHLPTKERIPSPVLNKPSMSPTQGNPGVGPIAGVPGSSPPMQQAFLATPHLNGANAQYTPQQQVGSRTSSFSSSQPQPMSGLSPMKQRTSMSPLPQPSLVPQKSGTFQTPSSSFNNNHNMRSVSGTPIFPPAENLAPSPYQLNREPVPTPSKHSPPSSQTPAQGSSQSFIHGDGPAKIPVPGSEPSPYSFSTNETVQ